MRDINVHKHLKTSDKISLVRFEGSLYFANAGYFESKVLEVVAANPKMKFHIIDGQGINQIDATGEAVLRHLHQRLKSAGIRMVTARMKK